MYQAGSSCYQTPELAAAAAATGQAGAVVTAGQSAYIVSVVGVSGTNITYGFTPVVPGSYLEVTAPFAAPACGMLTGSDGLALGWGVAAVWLAAFAVLALTRGYRHGDA